MADTKLEKSTVTWFEALNQQTDWTDQEKFLGWLTGVVGQPLRPSSAEQDRFTETLRRIRLHLGCIHFGLAEDLAWLNRQLKSCRPELFPVSDATVRPRLPAFRVDASAVQKDGNSVDLNSDSDDDYLLEALRLTLLLQFAEFVGGSIDADDADVARVDRCRGLYRDDVPLPVAAVYPPSVESQWRKEIEVLQENEFSADDVLRCEYFFLKTAKARFCSDACRFSTFQIMKQLQEPGYLATKQKRYRLKNKS